MADLRRLCSPHLGLFHLLTNGDRSPSLAVSVTTEMTHGCEILLYCWEVGCFSPYARPF